MRYLRFQVELGADGWYVRSPRLTVEEQLSPFPSRLKALLAWKEIRELEEAAWAARLFGAEP